MSAATVDRRLLWTHIRRHLTDAVVARVRIHPSVVSAIPCSISVLNLSIIDFWCPPDCFHGYPSTFSCFPTHRFCSVLSLSVLYFTTFCPEGRIISNALRPTLLHDEPNRTAGKIQVQVILHAAIISSNNEVIPSSV